MSARKVALLSILLAWSATLVMPIQGTAQEETATVAVNPPPRSIIEISGTGRSRPGRRLRGRSPTRRPTPWA